jgi:hypothetical protein
MIFSMTGPFLTSTGGITRLMINCIHLLAISHMEKSRGIPRAIARRLGEVNALVNTGI